MNDLMPSGDGSKTKSFWERPEGTTGMLTIAVLGLGGFFLVQAILPMLIAFLGMAISAVGQMLVLGVLCAVAAGFLFVITNKKFQILMSYMFKSSMRAVTGTFIEIDPIGIMKSYIDDMREKKTLMVDRTNKLSGQMKVCQNQINQNARDAETSLETAKIAHDQGKNSLFTVNARMAGRLKQSNMTLQDLMNRMTLLYRALTKYADAADTVIADLTSEVRVREQERNMILSSHTAMRAAMSILNGDADKKEMFDQAMEFVVDDYGKKLGEIEDFMSSSQTFIDGLDLQNGVFEEEALKQLSTWESKADSILLGDDKRLMLENMTTTQVSQRVPPAALPQTVGSPADYGKFFN